MDVIFFFFPFYMYSEAVLKELLVENCSFTENFLPYPVGMNLPRVCFVISYGHICHIVFVRISSVTRYLLFVTFGKSASMNICARGASSLFGALTKKHVLGGLIAPLLLCQKNLLCFKLERYQSCITEPSHKLLFQQLKLYTTFIFKKN